MNPFIKAYHQSDTLGHTIFWGLFFLSAISWSLIVHKTWLFVQVRKFSSPFASLFSSQDPLRLHFPKITFPHPLFEIYKAFKIKALAITAKNYGAGFSSSDLELLEGELQVACDLQTQRLEQNLFILSTIVTLGPFIGLLGTVWGILLAQGRGGEEMLVGLSLALATTVLGILVAIPALIGHNYLKNAVKEHRRQMESFSYQLLSSVELHYVKKVATTSV
jgi:biopolymer transport protein TolQ